MRGIITDPEVGANFVVLMIVKLSQTGEFDGTVTVFHSNGAEYRGELVIENEYG
jgi:hypothetical protein